MTKATWEAGQTLSRQHRRRLCKVEHLRVEPILINSSNKQQRPRPKQSRARNNKKKNALHYTHSFQDIPTSFLEVEMSRG